MKKIVLLSVMVMNTLFADSLMDNPVLNSPKIPASDQFKRAERTAPKFDYKIRDTITVNVNIDDTIDFSKKQDYKRDKSIGMAFKNFITHFGHQPKTPLPNIEYEGESEVKSKGTKRDQSTIRLEVPCEVVEIMPNGDLVLDGIRVVTAGENTASVKIGGRINPRFIDVERLTVMSERILQLKVDASFDGPLARNEQDGWFAKIFEKIRPF